MPSSLSADGQPETMKCPECLVGAPLVGALGGHKGPPYGISKAGFTAQVGGHHFFASWRSAAL